VLTRETGGTGKLVLGVTLDGKTCGTAWLTSDLKASDSQSLELQNLEFTSPRAAKALPGLVKHLSRAAVLAPDFPFGDAAKRLEQIVESLTLLTSSAELHGQSALRQHQPVVKSRWGVPKVKGALVGDTGVVAFAELELELGLALEPKLADKPE